MTRTIVQAISEGSISAMKKVELNTSLIPTQHFTDVVKSLCGYITMPKKVEDVLVKMKEEKVASEEVVCQAYAATLALASLQDDPRIATAKNASAVVLKAKYGILFWLNRLLGRPDYIDAVRLKHPDKPSRPWDSSAVLLHALTHSDSEKIKQTFRTEHIVYRLALHQWIVLDDYIPTKRVSKQEALKWLDESNLKLKLAAVLKRFLIQPAFQGDVLEKWLEVVNGDADVIAHSTVLRLRRTLPLGYDAAVNIGVMADLVLSIESASRVAKRTQVHEALFANGAIPALMKSLAILAHCLHTATNPEFRYRVLPNIKETILAILHFVCKLPELSPRSVLKVRQAIRARPNYITTLSVLSSCAEADPSGVDTNFAAGVNHILEWMLTAQLLSYRVLGDVMKFAREWSPNGFYNQAYGTASGSTHNTDAWRVFRSAVIERAIFKCLFDRAKAKASLLCDGCDKQFMPSALKKCASCKYRRYCSVRCQAYSWRVEGHKHECKEYKQRTDTFSLTPVEPDFITRFACLDIRHCLPGLRRLASNLYPSTPLDRLVIIADYTYTHQSESGQRNETRPMPGAGALYSIEPESILNSDPQSRAVRASRSGGELFAVVKYIWDGNAISCGVNVDQKVNSPPRRRGWTRETCKVERVTKYGAIKSPGPGREARAVHLETVEWDEVDEIWAMAQREIEAGEELEGEVGDNPRVCIWDAIERAALTLEAEWQRFGVYYR